MLWELAWYALLGALSVLGAGAGFWGMLRLLDWSAARSVKRSPMRSGVINADASWVCGLCGEQCINTLLHTCPPVGWREINAPWPKEPA